VPADHISTFQSVATPEEAVERLITLHDSAIEAQRQALDHFFSTGTPPTPFERSRFRYPELRRGLGFMPPPSRNLDSSRTTCWSS
jgi:AMP nucleosidase